MELVKINDPFTNATVEKIIRTMNEIKDIHANYVDAIGIKNDRSNPEPLLKKLMTLNVSIALVLFKEAVDLFRTTGVSLEELRKVLSQNYRGEIVESVEIGTSLDN